MTAGHTLTAAAEADPRDIIRHTRKQWGDEQARLYAAKPVRGIERVAAGAGAFKTLDDLHPGLRVARCERHLIFCLPRDGAPALIVAILHERMNLVARVAGRL